MVYCSRPNKVLKSWQQPVLLAWAFLLAEKEVKNYGIDTRGDIRRISKETTVPGAVYKEDDARIEGVSERDKRAGEARARNSRGGKFRVQVD